MRESFLPLSELHPKMVLQLLLTRGSLSCVSFFRPIGRRVRIARVYRAHTHTPTLTFVLSLAENPDNWIRLMSKSLTFISAVGRQFIVLSPIPSHFSHPLLRKKCGQITLYTYPQQKDTHTQSTVLTKCLPNATGGVRQKDLCFVRHLNAATRLNSYFGDIKMEEDFDFNRVKHHANTHDGTTLHRTTHSHKTIRKWFVWVGVGVGAGVCVRRQYSSSSSRVLILSLFYSLSLLHPTWWKAPRMEGADARTHTAYCMC